MFVRKLTQSYNNNSTFNLVVYTARIFGIKCTSVIHGNRENKEERERERNERQIGGGTNVKLNRNPRNVNRFNVELSIEDI